MRHARELLMRWMSVCVLAASAWAAGAERSLPDPSASRDRLRDALTQALTGHQQTKAVLSAHVLDLDDGSTLFELNADRPMMPASVMKLVVAAAAIDQLGADFRFQTRLAVTDRDLVVIGDGDPTLGDERLSGAAGRRGDAVFQAWADALLGAGIREIPGRLLIDDSIFDAIFVHPHWPPNQYQEWYAAPIGGLNYADNCFEVVVTPATTGPLGLGVVPMNGFVRLVNQTAADSRNRVAARRARDATQVVVSGSSKSAARLGPIAVTDPGLFFAACLRSTLSKRGISIAGATERVRMRDTRGVLDGNIRTISTHESPLSGAVVRACRDSLGMMAEGLLKRAGAGGASVGSWQTGSAAVAQFLRKQGISDDSFVIDDGSGLSRNNRLSARTVTTVLAAAQRAPGGGLLYESLARPGRLGTLERRLRTSDTRDRIRAKTGYINGVRTLAGYVDSAGGHRLAFAFLYNGTATTLPLTRAQDAACRILAHWPNDPPALAPPAASKAPAKRR